MRTNPYSDDLHKPAEPLYESYDRIRRLSRATPARNSAELLWSHEAVFVGLDPCAGQVRTTPLALGNAYYARPDLIIDSLDDRFGILTKENGFKGLSRDDFIDQLAHHISELNAIAPFVMGNRRIIGLHAAQLANQAGHEIKLYDADKSFWDRIFYRAFIHCETSGIGAALAGNAINEAAELGPGGIPLLPVRDAPIARRYLKSLKFVRQELAEHLPQARSIANTGVETLHSNSATANKIATTQQLVNCVNHANGPEFMLALLDALCVKKIEAVIHDEQTPLERIHELMAGMTMCLVGLPRAAVEQASLTLQSTLYPNRSSPHQERMTAQFIKNSASVNRADPRFAEAQRIVDAAIVKASATAGRDPINFEVEIEKAKRDIADRIQRGDAGILNILSSNEKYMYTDNKS